MALPEDPLFRRGPDHLNPVPLDRPTPGHPLIWRADRPLVLNHLHLEPGRKVPIQIKVEVPPDARPGRYRVYADQYWRHLQLGRVNLEVEVRATPVA